jgi:hypothetical protein
MCQKEQDKQSKISNLIKFPTLQNNLAGIFGSGSSRRRKTRNNKRKSHKNRRNRTRKN